MKTRAIPTTEAVRRDGKRSHRAKRKTIERKQQRATKRAIRGIR